MTKLYLDFKQIKQLTGFSRTTLWRLERSGCFPTHINVSPKRVGWSIESVRRWANSKGLLEGSGPFLPKRIRTTGERFRQQLVGWSYVQASEYRRMHPEGF